MIWEAVAAWWAAYGIKWLMLWASLVVLALAVLAFHGKRNPRRPTPQDDNEQWRYLVERTFIKALDTRARETDHTDAWKVAEDAAARQPGDSRNIKTWTGQQLLNATRALRR